MIKEDRETARVYANVEAPVKMTINLKTQSKKSGENKKMKKLSILPVLAIALLSLVSMAQATTPITGSLSWVATGVTQDVPLTLSASNQFWLTGLLKVTGTGDFYSVPTDLGAIPDPTLLDTTTNATLLTFGFTDPNFGTWVTTSGTHTHSADGTFLNVALTGTFTPGLWYPTNSMNTGELNITFSEAGSSLSADGTMALKAVPEASTLVGFGSALAMAGPGLIGWLRRRRS